MNLHRRLTQLAKMKFGSEAAVLRDYGFHFDTELRAGYWLKQPGSPVKRYLGQTDSDSEQAILTLSTQEWKAELDRYKKNKMTKASA